MKKYAQIEVGDIVWFYDPLAKATRRKGDQRQHGVVTGTWANVLHVSCFNNGRNEALFPQTYNVYWGVLK